MADNKFYSLLVGLVLFVLFSWVILSLTVDFGNEYGRSATEIGDGSFKVSDFQDEAENVRGDAESYRERFESGNVDDVDDASGVFSVVTGMISMITTPFSLLGKIAENIFGVPSLVINVILGLLSIGLILAIWSILRSGY